MQDLIQRSLSGPSTEDIQSRMDPYISSVLKELTLQAERDYDVQRAKLGDLASSAGAFGGSRLGVAESELGDRFIEDLASIRSQGLSNAFNNALNQYNVDIGRGFEGYSQLANLANTGQSQLSWIVTGKPNLL